MMAVRKHQAGFTIVELVIALGVLALVTSQVLGMFSSQLQVQITQKRVLVAQEDSQLVADMMRRDARMAGFMIPTTAGVSSVDGGTNGPDIFCASDLSLLSATRLDEATARFDGVSLSADLGGAAGGVQLVASQMDLDGDGNIDFAVDQGIILTLANATHCARIKTISSGTLTFEPPTPSGFAIAAAGAIAVPAVIYELQGSEITRNNVALSSQVEDVQIEFGVDVNQDGQVVGTGEFPIHSLIGFDPTLVRTVRLSILTRTTREDNQLTGSGRQGIANRAAAGADDNFQRRLVTVTAAPRNFF